MTNVIPREIELKLALPPERVADFLARMARRRAPPQTQALHTRYFDTPDFDLSAAGVAVRVRRAGRRWVQTLKTRGERLGGLSNRIEFETPVPRGEPDWTRFPPEALAYVPPVWRDRLIPVFETRFERLTWQVAGQRGAQIEVALDRGEVRARQGRNAGVAREPICEIELELKRGASDALFDLARTWAAALDCLPNDDSKAARGVRLAHGIAPAPVKPGAPVLDADMRVEDGFAEVCRHALASFQANLPGVLAADDIEYLHQARVALRRLRAALRFFRRVCALPPELRAGLRALAASLGPARDWDVLCRETLPALAVHVPDTLAWQAECARLDAQRAAVRAAMQRALAAARPGVWLLDMSRWLLRQGWREAPADRRAQTRALGPWAKARVRRGHRRLLQQTALFDSLSREERHALRGRFKRQRYALEDFASLMPSPAGTRQLARLRAAQDALGQANDVGVARTLLLSLPDDITPARAFALGWLAAQDHVAGSGKTAKALKNFVKSGVDW